MVNENKSSANDPQEEEISLLTYFNSHLETIQNKFGLKGKYVVIFIVSMVTLVFVGIFDRFITNMVATLYPAYSTIKSLEAKTNDDKQWLSYWVVFGIFSIIDMFSPFFLRLTSLYFFFKIIFLLWCFMPNTQGATILYNLIIVHFFRKIEKDIEDATSSFQNEIVSLVKKEDNQKLKNKKKNI